MWTPLRIPVGGFGNGGGAWKSRPASGTLSDYDIDLGSGTIRRRDGKFGDNGVIASRPLDKSNDKSYRLVTLHVPHRQTFRLHSLVCWAAFGPMPAGCSSVDHIDSGDPSINCSANLRWASLHQQAANRRPGGYKAGLPFVLLPGEVLFEYEGSPGVEYAGPQLQFTNRRRIVRSGKLSQASSMRNGYPALKIKGLGVQQIHRIAWSAFHGKDAVVPSVINHIDGDKTNWAPENLEKSDYSHNGFAAHDGGAHDGGSSKRMKLSISLSPDFAASGPWLFDGKNEAVFESQHAAARALKKAGACSLSNIRAGISKSISSKGSFTVLVGGAETKAWAASVCT